MSRKKDTVEKTLSNLPPDEQQIIAAIGRCGLESIRSGMYWIAQWLWAMADFQARHPEMCLSQRKEIVAKMFGDRELEFEILVNDAARKRDGTQLRLLADAIELTGVQKDKDPVTSFVLSQKANGAKLMNDREAQQYLRKVHGHSVTTRTLRETRKKLKAPRARRGAPIGTKQKSDHR